MAQMTRNDAIKKYQELKKCERTAENAVQLVCMAQESAQDTTTVIKHFKEAIELAKPGDNRKKLILQYYNYVPSTPKYQLTRHIAWRIAWDAGLEHQIPSAASALADLRQSWYYSEGTRLNSPTELVQVLPLIERVSILRIGHHQLSDTITRALLTATNITDMTLSFNEPVNSVAFIGTMPWLRYLSIERASFEQLPLEICTLQHLRRLTIRGCANLQEMPSKLTLLKNMKKLCVFNCERLTALPDSIGHMTSLTYLDVSWTGIRKLPGTFGCLTALTTFKRDGCCNLKPIFPYNYTANDIVNWMQRSYEPAKVLMLILIARRRRQRHLPDELWTILILNEFCEMYYCTDRVRDEM